MFLYNLLSHVLIIHGLGVKLINKGFSEMKAFFCDITISA